VVSKEEEKKNSGHTNSLLILAQIVDRLTGQSALWKIRHFDAIHRDGVWIALIDKRQVCQIDATST
jgi:hypothetical protein